MKTILWLFAAFAALLTSAAGGEAAAPLVKVNVGYLAGATGHSKLFIAQEAGLFKQNGLDVNLVAFPNSGDGLAAIRANKIVAGPFGAIAPFIHIAKGADIRLIAGIMGEDAAVIVKPENAAGIKTIADLKGRKVAVIRLSTGDAVVRGALKKAGLDWRKDLQIIELKTPPAVIEAVKTGKVDAGVTWGPHDRTAENQGLKVVLRSRDLAPGHPCCRLIALGRNVDQDAGTLKKLIKSLIQAEKLAAEDHEKALDYIGKWINVDRETLRTAYYSGYVDQTTDPNRAGLRDFWAIAKDASFIEADKNPDDYINTAIYKAALDELVAEHPDDQFYRKAKQIFDSRN